MKKIVLILSLMMFAISSYCEIIRKEAKIVNSNDTVLITYSDGVWTIESDTFLIINIDSITDGTNSYSIAELADSGGDADTSGLPVANQIAYFITANKIGGNDNLTHNNSKTLGISDSIKFSSTVNIHKEASFNDLNLEAGDNQIKMGDDGGDGIVIDSDNGVTSFTTSSLSVTSNSGNVTIEDSTIRSTGQTIVIDDNQAVNGILKSSNPKFYAACADSSVTIDLTQNIPTHITNGDTILTVYRNDGGFTFQNDSVQIPELNNTDWYCLEVTISGYPASSDTYEFAFSVDGVPIANRGQWVEDLTGINSFTTTAFMNYQFSGGEWVKLTIENVTSNNDVDISDINWRIKFDE